MASKIIGSSGIETDDIIRFVRDTLCIQTMQIMQALIEFLAMSSSWQQAKNRVRRIFQQHQAIEKFMRVYV